MKKETAVAKAEFGIENFPKSVTDPETGLKVKVTHDMIAALISAERQITSGLEQIAMSLHKIRKEKLYLLYDLKSMEDYLDQRFQFARSFGYYLLKMADVFGDSKHFADIMRQPRKLLEIAAKDEGLTKQMKEGEITLPDGTVTTLKDLKKTAASELATDLKIAKDELKTMKADLKKSNEQLEQKAKLLAHYESAAGQEGFQKITEKSRILSELHAIDAESARIIDVLARIETEDPACVSKLSSVLSGILSAASAVQSNYIDLILPKSGK